MLPNGWKSVMLKDISSIYDGTHQTPSYVERGIPFYSVEHLTSKNFAKTKFISESIYEKESKKRKIEKNDILMTRIGDIGTAKIIDWDVEASFYVSLSLIKPKNNIYPKFLELFINSNLFYKELWKKIIHVAFPKKINLSDIGKCFLLLPPLEEQKKIAAILSTWDRAIEETEKLLANSQQQKKALMQQLLTGKKRLPGYTAEWKIKNLGDIADIQTGSSNRQDSLTNGEYTFFDRSEDIRTSNRYLFDCEAVIVPGEGQDFIPKYFAGKFDLHQRTYAISSFRACDGKFIFYIVSYHRSHFLSQAVGSTVKSLRLPMFQRMPLKLPPLPEQQAIAAVLTTADDEITTIESDLARLRQEKKALMQQLLTGKRRVKVD